MDLVGITNITIDSPNKTKKNTHKHDTHLENKKKIDNTSIRPHIHPLTPSIDILPNTTPEININHYETRCSHTFGVMIDAQKTIRPPKHARKYCVIVRARSFVGVCLCVRACE